jgi:hypothetical protein
MGSCGRADLPEMFKRLVLAGAALHVLRVVLHDQAPVSLQRVRSNSRRRASVSLMAGVISDQVCMWVFNLTSAS